MTDVKQPIEEEETIVDETPSEDFAVMEIQAPRRMTSTEDEPRPDIPDVLSILPLRDSVIYPMLIAPLSVARDNSVQLIDESVGGQSRVIGVVAQIVAGGGRAGLRRRLRPRLRGDHPHAW